MDSRKGSNPKGNNPKDSVRKLEVVSGYERVFDSIFR
jgi:hypothetical protein